jgi:EVE domain
MTDWIFQGSRSQLHLDAAITASRQLSWRTPRYRNRTAAGDRVWLQVTGRHDPGIYYLAEITAPTYENPDWHDHDPASARWKTDIRFDYRLDPPLLRIELEADPALAAFHAFRGFQGSTVPVPADIAALLRERTASRLDPI